jgi:hypothetical protein
MGRSSTDHRPLGAELIDRWVDDGLITNAQADRMRADLDLGPAPAQPVSPSSSDRSRIVARPLRDRTSLMIEALAYLGGVIVLVAAGLLAAQYWDAMSEVAQLGAVGGAAALLLIAGLAVPKHLGATSIRLRSVLWLLSTAATAAFLALFADLVLELGGDDILLVSSAGTAALAAALWWRLPTFPQQAMFFTALMVAGAAIAAKATDNPHVPGLPVWALGVVWFVLGWRGVLKPRRSVLAAGAVGTLVGAAFTLPTDAGMVLALCTVVAIVVLAVLFRDLLLLAVGALGALNILPSVITEWFPGELAPPLVLLGFGGLLVAAAVYTAKRGKP